METNCLIVDGEQAPADTQLTKVIPQPRHLMCGVISEVESKSSKKLDSPKRTMEQVSYPSDRTVV